MSAEKGTVVQCSKNSVPEYIVDQLMNNFPGWDYRHFDDDSMKKFMIDNPLKEFPDAEKILDLFTGGAHKADYFRYFYLYSRGGIFIDSDLMIEQNILDDINNNDLVTVINKRDDVFIFQGLLYCDAGNKIIYQALENLYKRKINDFALRLDYHAICRDLYKIIISDNLYKKKIYTEDYVLIKDENFPTQAAALIIDDDKIIGVHYYQEKNIPQTYMKSDNYKRILGYI